MAYRKGLVFNVLDYGADNGGNTGTATATTAAINACISAAISGAPGAQKCVYFPAGNYVINGTIAADADGLTIYGDGVGATLVSTTANGTMFSLGNDSTTVRARVDMHGMTLWYQYGSSVSRSASIGLIVNNCKFGLFHDMDFFGLGVGISILGDSGWCHFSNLDFVGTSVGGNLTNSSRVGFSNEPTGAEIARAVSTGVIIQNVNGVGLYDATVKCVPGAGDWIFNGIQGYGTVANSAAIWFDRASAAYSDYMAVSNVKMDGVGRAAVYLINQNRGSITNVASGGAITNSVYLSGCTNMAVAGIGTAAGGTSAAIALVSGSTITNSIVDGETQITLSNGDTNHNLVVTSSFVEIVGPTAAFNVGGIAGGWGGRLVTFWSNAAYAMTVDFGDASSTAANQITVAPQTNVICGGTSPAWFTVQYSAAISRWVLLGHS